MELINSIDINLVIESSASEYHRYFTGPLRLVSPGTSDGVP